MTAETDEHVYNPFPAPHPAIVALTDKDRLRYSLSLENLVREYHSRYGNRFYDTINENFLSQGLNQIQREQLDEIIAREGIQKWMPNDFFNLREILCLVQESDRLTPGYWGYLFDDSVYIERSWYSLTGWLTCKYIYMVRTARLYDLHYPEDWADPEIAESWFFREAYEIANPDSSKIPFRKSLCGSVEQMQLAQNYQVLIMSAILDWYQMEKERLCEDDNKAEEENDKQFVRKVENSHKRTGKKKKKRGAQIEEAIDWVELNVREKDSYRSAAVRFAREEYPEEYDGETCSLVETLRKNEEFKEVIRELSSKY